MKVLNVLHVVSAIFVLSVAVSASAADTRVFRPQSLDNLIEQDLDDHVDGLGDKWKPVVKGVVPVEDGFKISLDTYNGSATAKMSCTKRTLFAELTQLDRPEIRPGSKPSGIFLGLGAASEFDAPRTYQRLCVGKGFKTGIRPEEAFMFKVEKIALKNHKHLTKIKLISKRELPQVMYSLQFENDRALIVDCHNKTTYQLFGQNAEFALDHELQQFVCSSKTVLPSNYFHRPDPMYNIDPAEAAK